MFEEESEPARISRKETAKRFLKNMTCSEGGLGKAGEEGQRKAEAKLVAVTEIVCKNLAV